MNDAHLVLAAIAQNKWRILALCSVAMICNDVWLAGDASIVLRYDQWFHVYDHLLPHRQLGCAVCSSFAHSAWHP
jgi:hypothetical protein